MKLRNHVPKTFHTKKSFGHCLCFEPWERGASCFNHAGLFQGKSPLECVFTHVDNHLIISKCAKTLVTSRFRCIADDFFTMGTLPAWWSQLFISTDLRIPTIEGTKHQNPDLSALRLQLLWCYLVPSPPTKMRLLQVAPKECPTGAALELQFTTRCSTCAAASRFSGHPGVWLALGKRVHVWFDLGMSQDHWHHGFRMTIADNRHLWIHPIGPVRSHLHIFLVSMPSFCCNICRKVLKSAESPGGFGALGVSSLHCFPRC